MHLTLYTPISVVIYSGLFFASFYKMWKKHDYTFAILTLITVLATITLHRFFVVNTYELNDIDIKNLLILGSPLIPLVYLSKHYE